MGLKSSSIEILPVIAVNCYCIEVSQRRKPEHPNNPLIEGGETMNTNHHAEKKSLLLDEVSVVWWVPTGVCPARLWGMREKN